jgi:hypothetical protein
MTFSAWFAEFKASPKTWDAALPILACLATHYAHHWWIPLLAILLAFFIPKAPQAQRIHFCIGLLTTAVLGRWGLLFIFLFAYLEFVFDPKNEGDPVLPGGLIDFASYAAGQLAGLV